MPLADTLSAGAIKLLKEPQLGHLATLMSDGSPQITPVWVDVTDDGKRVLINTEDSRLKATITARDNRVALRVADAKDAQRTVGVRGTVVERQIDGSVDHMDKLVQKYLGLEKSRMREPGDVRIVLHIEPIHIMESGAD